jgi:shikimate kinase
VTRTVWLIGMMGSGKSTVGEELARRLEVPFYDTDTEIVARIGCSIGELWGVEGESAFRDLEASEVARLAGREAVVATGGGVVLRPENVAAMRESGSVVWLRTSVEELAARVGAGDGRPLLAEGPVADRMSAVLDERSALYEVAASIIVETDGLTVEQVVGEVERWIAS